MRLPPGFHTIASLRTSHVRRCPSNPFFIWNAFHPEVDHTEQGQDLLKHFAEVICGCQTFHSQLDPDKIIREIKEKVGENEVICGVSGGVDSL